MGNWEPVELAFKPDAAAALERVEAWWCREIVDRPTVQVIAPRAERGPLPKKEFAATRDRWLDTEWIVDYSEASMRNTWYGGEIFPTLHPNLGPEILSAAYGAELEFSETTSWSVPCLHDWSQVDALRFDAANPYVQKILEITRLSLERGKGKWLTGITDLHPGGDLAASLRDPQEFCVDLLNAPVEAKRLLARLEESFFRFYELQEAPIRAAGQRLSTTWLPMVVEGRYYVPSNDFSIMISAEMFREFFLAELHREMAYLDRSIYHLDGPGALRHLPALLECEDLDGIQFVYGAGNGPASRWMHVYREIQAAGKLLHFSVGADDVDPFIEQLAPEGVMLCVGVRSVAEGEALIGKISRWTRPGGRR